MTSKIWLFEAIDTWFFRDGTPFIAGETDSRGIRSIFPPTMSTVQGAVRAALAMGQGWCADNGGTGWPKELGNHSSLGDLRLAGPYVAQDKEGRCQFLFPCPASVVWHGNPDNPQFVHLIPDDEPCKTDFADTIRLTKLPEGVKKVHGVAGLWLTVTGLKEILAGQGPGKEQVVQASTLWGYENRVGININSSKKTVEKGRLYALHHVRPAQDLRLAVGVAGIPDSWHQVVPEFIPFGGEGRMARVVVYEPTGEVLPEMPELGTVKGKVRFVATLLTPGHFDDVGQVVKEGPVTDTIGACVSACVPKLSQSGGWDIQNNCPRPLKPVVVPGSTWFYEVEADKLNEIKALHGSHVGISTEYGYGQILIGKWGDNE